MFPRQARGPPPTRVQMLGAEIDRLRQSDQGRAQLLHAASARLAGSLEGPELERLQHTFVRLGGGDARRARVTGDRLT